MSIWQNIFSKKVQHPLFVQQYLDSCGKPVEKKLPIEAIRFAVIDTETNGLDPDKAALLSFGGLIVTNNSIYIAESIEVTVFASDAHLSEDVSVHGITQKQIRDGLKAEGLIENLLSFIGNAVLVAHHGSFDLTVLNKLLREQYHFKLRNKLLDTAILAQRLEQFLEDPLMINPEDYRLDQLCQRYNISPHDRHTAAGDAFITAQLLLKLLAKAQKKGIRTYGELMRQM